MKFKIIVNEWAIFYFFIQNLSEWHFSNRKNYNTLWRKELGPFSREEENILKKFKKIHLHYPFGKLYLGRYFFLEKDPWEMLKKKLSQKNFVVIRDSFFLLEEKFNRFYKKGLPLLKKWRTVLQKELRNKSLIKSINVILAKLYNTTPLSKDIIVYILPSAKNYTGGTGGTVDDKSVNLEISRCTPKTVNHALGIIWHEIIHTYFEKQYFSLLIEKLYPGLRKKGIYINEIAASSLFPRGVLSNKFLHSGLGGPSYFKSSYFGNAGRKSTELFSLIEKYVSKKKPLDQSYIERVLSLV